MKASELLASQPLNQRPRVKCGKCSGRAFVEGASGEDEECGRCGGSGFINIDDEMERVAP